MESAFVLVLFAFTVFGVVEVTRLAYAFNYVSYSARDAARWASVRGANSPTPADASAITEYVRRNAVAVNPAAIKVKAVWSPDNRPGSTVQVEVNYDWTSALNAFIPADVNVRGTSRVVVLQ